MNKYALNLWNDKYVSIELQIFSSNKNRDWGNFTFIWLVILVKKIFIEKYGNKIIETNNNSHQKSKK